MPTIRRLPDGPAKHFKLRQDYPQTLPPPGSRSWTSLSFKTKPNDYLKAVLAFALEGNK